jgi:uncharacterized protein
MLKKPTWFQTCATKAKINILNPSQDSIFVEDIALALSNNCRFNGHVNKWYSVAEHSLNVTRWMGKNASSSLLLGALLHDASEAYLSDIISDVKHCGKLNQYIKIEKNVQKAIHDKFKLNLSKEEIALIKQADVEVLIAEARALLDIDPVIEWPDFTKPSKDYSLRYWGKEKAKSLFIEGTVLLSQEL